MIILNQSQLKKEITAFLVQKNIFADIKELEQKHFNFINESHKVILSDKNEYMIYMSLGTVKHFYKIGE